MRLSGTDVKSVTGSQVGYRGWPCTYRTLHISISPRRTPGEQQTTKNAVNRGRLGLLSRAMYLFSGKSSVSRSWPGPIALADPVQSMSSLLRLNF